MTVGASDPKTTCGNCSVLQVESSRPRITSLQITALSGATLAERTISEYSIINTETIATTMLSGVFTLPPFGGRL